MIGAGNRGNVYARFLQEHSDCITIIGIADPDAVKRERFAKEYNISSEHVFSDWKAPLSGGRIADAVIIATPDHLHIDPVVAYAQQKYHILLEKPMAPTEEGCRRIVEAVQRQSVHFMVCHVLRYTHYSQVLRDLIQKGAIGQPMSIQHLEPVGYWHMAHSFVRGNWRRADESSFMLLAKSCHDMDWISFIMGRPIQRVSSFGRLSHFISENAPQGASKRCVDCPVEAECPYSAQRIYVDRMKKEGFVWPVDVITNEPTLAGVRCAIQEGPYGRCVFDCDNDVVDHQVVSMQFEGGATGVFTMTGFTKPDQPRYTKIFGTKGEIYCDWDSVEIYDFLTEKSRRIEGLSDRCHGHEDADQALIASFVAVLCDDDEASLLSGSQQTLQTHLAVFAAERARLNGTIEDVDIEKRIVG